MLEDGIVEPEDTWGSGSDAQEQPARILVVDDEPEVCDVLAETLVLAGNQWEVVREVDPTHALERMRDEPFDCLITDIVMPRMSGIELAKNAQALSEDVALIAVTGKGTLTDSIEALKLGFQDFIEKPFDLDEVRMSVARSLTHHRHRLQLRQQLAELAQQNAVLKAKEAQLNEKLDLASYDLVLSSKRLARQVLELGQAAKVSALLSGTLELNDLLLMCAEILADAVPCRSATIGVYDADENTIPVIARAFSESDEAGVLHWFKRPMADGILCLSVAKKEIIHLENVKECDLLADSERRLWHEGQVLVVPLLARDSCVGAVAIARADDAPGFEQADVDRARQLADVMAPAVVAAKTHHTERIQICSALDAVVDQLERRDFGFFGHGQRVSMYATLLGETLELPRPEIGVLQIAARLHDIGRLDVPDAVLNKPGPLSAEEMLVLQSHPKIGRQILAPIEFLSRVGKIILAHHEWIDGTGYPKGLKGPDIPFLARILAAADILDTITSPRPHRGARSLEEAIEEIKAGSNHQFDGQVVEALLGIPREMLEDVLKSHREPRPK